jgi:hypothetical protein
MPHQAITWTAGGKQSKQVDVLFVQNAKNVTINKDKLVLRGVNTRDARDELRRSVANGVALLWPEENTASTGLKAVEGAALVLGLLVGSAKSSFDEVNLNAMDKRVSVEKFITISTPWGGHAAAKFGIRALKYPAPAWIDMAPRQRVSQSSLAGAAPAGEPALPHVRL